MKINWKLRLKNKTTLVALVTVTVAFAYQAMSIIGFAPKVAEADAMEVIMALINILAAVGIIVDPTTKGIGDNDNVMNFVVPKGDDADV